MKQLKKLMSGRRRSTIIIGAALVAIIALVPTLAFSGGSFITKKTAKKLDTKTLNKAVAQATAASLPNDVRYVRNEGNIASGTVGAVVATCPAGYHVVGGGHEIASPGTNTVTVLTSGPSNGTAGQAGATAWQVNLLNNFGVARTLRVYAICEKPSKVTITGYAEGSGTL